MMYMIVMRASSTSTCSHLTKLEIHQGCSIVCHNYCFADIWIGIKDIQPYFAVKEVEKISKD